jgi:hypothetical protein
MMPSYVQAASDLRTFKRDTRNYNEKFASGDEETAIPSNRRLLPAFGKT